MDAMPGYRLKHTYWGDLRITDQIKCRVPPPIMPAERLYPSLMNLAKKIHRERKVVLCEPEDIAQEMACEVIRCGAQTDSYLIQMALGRARDYLAQLQRQQPVTMTGRRAKE